MRFSEIEIVKFEIRHAPPTRAIPYSEGSGAGHIPRTTENDRELVCAAAANTLAGVTRTPLAVAVRAFADLTAADGPI